MSHRNDCNGFLLSATTLPPTPNFSHGRQSSTWERLNQIMTFFSSKLSNSFPSQDKIQSPDHHLQDLKNTAPSISLTPSLTRSLPRSLVFSYSGFEVFVLTFSFAWNAFLPDISWFAPELALWTPRFIFLHNTYYTRCILYWLIVWLLPLEYKFHESRDFILSIACNIIGVR